MKNISESIRKRLLNYPDSLTATEIRKEQGYSGIRINLLGTLGSAKISIQVDIGFGDALLQKQKRIVSL